MLKVGITGQQGFVGQHLYNTLGISSEPFERIEFQRGYFEDNLLLNDFVSRCDVIVHLSAVNRHDDPHLIYDQNLELVHKLIKALVDTNSKAHVLFSSSTQEERDSLYGKSKKEGRELLANWAHNSDGKFTGLIIPNVFGPFGHPFYNSFIATFCRQLIDGENPTINEDGEVNLIYVDELVTCIIKAITLQESNPLYIVQPTSKIKVSEVLNRLENFKSLYLACGVIPELKNRFELNLFNTFRSYIDHTSMFPIKLKEHSDARGSFVEIVRLGVGGQVSFSTTLPGVTRGNHFHSRKIERFAVIRGEALIQLRKIGTSKIFAFRLSGDNPSYVDMPIWFTHNIRNVGNEELYTIFWINECFDINDPDTYMDTV